MAGNRHDVGAMYSDAFIEDMTFDFSGGIGKEPYPYPKSMSLDEPDTVSEGVEAFDHILDASRPPSSFIYASRSPKQTKSLRVDENLSKVGMHIAPPRERLICDHCGHSFGRRTDLRRHILEHSGNFDYLCTFEDCNRAFKRKDKFKDHIRRAHEPEENAQRAILPHLHNAMSLDLATEDRASNLPTTSESYVSPWDAQMCQLLNKNITTSALATDFNYALAENFITPPADYSRKGTPSTVSDTTFLSKDLKDIHPANLAEETSPAIVRLACPYRKYNPVDYNIHNRTTCALSYYNTVARVKEHVIRVHRAPPQCPRCWTCFSTESDLSFHLNDAICDLRQGSPAEGMTRDAEKRLRSRKRREQSEAKKWQEMYAILFPKEREIPSPYFVPIEDDVAAKDMFQFPRTFSSFENTFHSPVEFGNMPPPPSELSIDQTPHPNASSLREEIPALFRSKLDKALAKNGTPALEATLKSQIVDVVTEFCDDILLAQNGNFCVGNRDRDIREEFSSTTTTVNTFLPTVESMVDMEFCHENSEMNSFSFAIEHD